MIPATMTAGMLVIGCGLMSRLIDSQPANSALNRIIASTNRPARSSARRKPNVYERVAARPPMANAIHSGTAVSASEKLWTVSASSATEPEMRTTPSWSTAVTPSATSETWTARIPRLSPASAESSKSAGSWLWPTTAATIEASRPVGWAWPWVVAAVTALDVVVVRRVDVVRLRSVVVRMIRPVRRRRLVLVRTRPIAHEGERTPAPPCACTRWHAHHLSAAAHVRVRQHEVADRSLERVVAPR